MATIERIDQTATLGEAARVMRARGVSILVVSDAHGEPVGVLTERHLVDAVAASRHPDHGTAGSWMTPLIVDRPDTTRLPDTDTAALVAIAEAALA